MSTQSRSNSTKRSTKSHINALSDLSPFSTLACQVEATNTWRKDLKSLYSRASERFADVCWSAGEDEDGGMTDEEGVAPSWKTSSANREGVVWAHKAILYARAPNTFQARFLLLRTPASTLGAMASGSTVSLPAIRSPSPSMSLQSRNSSSMHSTKRKTVRGTAPPSSFSMSRNGSRNSTYAGNSDSEAEDGARPRVLKRNISKSSLASSKISRPINRDENRLSRQISYDSLQNTSSPSLTTDSDMLSVLSTTSTVKAPMSLDGVNEIFFQATLEYLYTAEESMKEAFEFLYEDRVAADEGPEERLEKLRQDLVFMWRSRLYADIEIIIGDEDDERATVRTIPDINASVTSLALPDGVEDEEETASFSAHRMMLVSRSPYFAAQLLSPYSDANTRIIRLPGPPFTPAALHFTLGFIYTGTLFFSNRTFDLSTAFQLWRSASYLQMDTLSTLVSSLITHDFCHGFTCSPPCKTCTKRVPRTLAFVSSPDVSDAHLQSLARSTISGNDFGSFWSKEVGNLDYAVRGALVSDVCSKVDANPGYAIHVLRQLSLIGTRIDVERNSRWVDAVRWMCESVESHVCAIVEAKLPEIIASGEWNSLIDGVGFLNDILEKVLSIIVDGLNEKRAAKTYEVVVGQILLREDGLPSNDIVALVEEARKSIILYLRKRWVNVRAIAGFNNLESWALKELADELDVPFGDLLLSEKDKPSFIAGPGDNFGQQTKTFPTSATSNGATRTTSRANRTVPMPGQVVDGEREAGPIHLRAAILNRNAARASVTNSSRSVSQNTSTSSRNVVGESASVMNRPRNSMGSSSSGVGHSNELGRNTDQSSSPRSVTSQSATIAARRPSSIKERPTRDAVQAASNVAGSSSQIPQEAASSSSSVKTPTPSIYSEVSSIQSRDESKATPTKRASASVAAYRSGSQQRNQKTTSSTIPAQKTVSADVRKRASEASLRTPPLLSESKLQTSSSQTASRGVRSRQTSASSTISTSAASLRKVGTLSTSTIANKTMRKVPSSKTVQKRKEDVLVPPLPTQVPAVLTDGSFHAKSNAMQLDEKEDNLKATNVPPSPFSAGTKLSSGIPCVVAPRNKNGKVTRFRAVVKYIGPLKNQGNSPFVGVEVALPLPSGVDENEFEFHRGAYMGLKYFEIGPKHQSAERNTELSHKPEREARRLRLEQMMQGRQPTEDATYVGQDARASAKRRKDLSGATLDLSPQDSLGLFIRPSDVLWVVI